MTKDELIERLSIFDGRIELRVRSMHQCADVPIVSWSFEWPPVDSDKHAYIALIMEDAKD